jgi:hypothetical protein
MKEKGITKWEAVEEIIEGGEGSINFFRDDNSSGGNYVGNNSSPKDRITTTFIGTWFYNENFKL